MGYRFANQALEVWRYDAIAFALSRSIDFIDSCLSKAAAGRRWLAFQSGQLDILELPEAFAALAVAATSSPPTLRARGSTCRAFSIRRFSTRLSTCVIPSSGGSRK